MVTVRRALGAAAAGVAVLAAGAQALEDKVEECTRSTCVTSDGGTEVFLGCGGADNTIKSVKFASFGAPTGTCPGINDQEAGFDSSLITLAASSCDAANSEQKIADLCVGKEECTLVLADVWAPGDVTLGSGGCPATFAELELAVQIECERKTSALEILITGVIVVIALGMGATVDMELFKRVVAEHKRALLVGVVGQFGIMPLVAFMWASVLDVNPFVAVAMLVVGSAPGGSLSNLMVYYAKGSVALSITMTAFSTLMALFMMPFLMFLYVDVALGLGDVVDIPFLNIFTTLLLVIFPALMGSAIRTYRPDVARKVELLGSGLGALFIIAALVVGIVADSSLLIVTDRPNMWIAATFTQPLAFLVSYWVAVAVKLPKPERRAVSIEVGYQNTTLAVTIVVLSYSSEACNLANALPYALIATFMFLVNAVIWVGILRFFARGEKHSQEDEELHNAGVDKM
ncbi:Ileal sodium/bile acid cotransporter (Apical sodium-dependent bile acid transporter) (ASBT) (Ileal Na(+)/bile acid cotransporter) (Ileal sodium-dependent bile acid transporter) (IBAT) (ISBT) (Na(+)-dependent ileal bile acid transporter) (Sodium/taurocholate cotransporting polypeptide, partial [Durusdinium trenchii]